ncbi:tetratricopeptide repeat protein [Streptomyces sp. NBC_01498]|uniref:tetratricopeptide repeat protein n=1 Tax=Streptomyces sp. NBC_01498 TaxID=2975870 RepID=UPI002E7B233B|nr:tetratricopeptide repeat protein [Streptomyces sp. NBC_01498]WTL25685.1 tetratricopeptide repeat protein [Streptomyces sp. NBC_01498]
MSQQMEPTGPSSRSPGRRRPRALRAAAVAVGLAAVLFAVGAVGFSPWEPGSGGVNGDDPGASSGSGSGAGAPRGSVEALRAELRRVPENSVGWAQLGMAYVEEGRTGADPAVHARAESALRRSLRIQPRDNYQAETGMGALAAARHDFATALTWGRKAAATNPSNAAAQGVLADAYTQLGRYEEAYRAVQRMTDLRPGTASLARASYTWELRGDVPRARALMKRALDSAASPSDRAFARLHLATLAQESGDAATALREASAGLREAGAGAGAGDGSGAGGSGGSRRPGGERDDAPLLEARARAHAALGHDRQAVEDYTAAVAIVPLPQYVLGLGELQESLGRKAEARTQYGILRAQERVRRAGGAPADTDAILFEADHGDADRAVTMGREAVEARPFIAVQDAHAWALHRAGRDAEALPYADRALALGTRGALSHYHRAMIHDALGNTAAAREDLARALALDPRFHPLHAPRARTALDRIDASS